MKFHGFFKYSIECSTFFFSVFDFLLYRPRTREDILEYEEVQRILRDEIVNPLRQNCFVRSDKVMKLRRLLQKLGSVTGLTNEEKGICSQMIFVLIVSSNPFFFYRS